MGVFDGGAFRLRVRDYRGETATHFVQGKEDAERVVAGLRTGIPQAQAVDVEYVHFVVSDYDTGLSFGDYWGDGEDKQ